MSAKGSCERVCFTGGTFTHAANGSKKVTENIEFPDHKVAIEVVLKDLEADGVRIEGNTVTQNGEPLFKIHRRHAARKTQGCYRELMPTLEYVKQEQKQEKPSIRDQLKAAAKTQPEKKSPVKSKTHDMEL